MNLFRTPAWETDDQNEKKNSSLFGGNGLKKKKNQKLKEKKKKVLMDESSQFNFESTSTLDNRKPKGKQSGKKNDIGSSGDLILQSQSEKEEKHEGLFKKNLSVSKNKRKIKVKNYVQARETSSNPVTEDGLEQSSKLKQFLKLTKKKEKANSFRISSERRSPFSSAVLSGCNDQATTDVDHDKVVKVQSNNSVQAKKLKTLLKRRRRREKMLALKSEKEVRKLVDVNEVPLTKKQEKKMKKIAQTEVGKMLEVNEVPLNKKQEKKMRKIAQKEAKKMKESDTNIGGKVPIRMDSASYDNSALENPSHSSPLKEDGAKREKRKEQKRKRKKHKDECSDAHDGNNISALNGHRHEKLLLSSVPLEQDGSKREKRRKRKRKQQKENDSDATDGNFMSASNKQRQEEDIPSDNSFQKKKLFKIKKQKIAKLLEEVEPELESTDLERKNTLYNLKKKRRSENQTEATVTSNKKTKKGLTPLRERLTEQLKSARFRWLNEQLYTSKSWDALKYFKEDPEAYEAYHAGYRSQVAQWPLNPLDVIIKDLSCSPAGTVVADFGCGDARLEECLPKLKVHSLDLVASKPNVVPCDMAHTPLLMSSVNVVVFCLSLMGTNLNDFLLEANRVLKLGGIMKIAEVESRFEDVDNFASEVHHYGFQLKKKDFSHKLFYFMDFKKVRNVSKAGKLPDVVLSPCIYKKR